MHRKLTPNKDRPAIRLTPFLFSFLSAFQLPKKTKNPLFLQIFLYPKFKTLSQHCSISMATASRHCVPHLHYRRSSCLSPSATGGAIVGATTTGGHQVLLTFSFIFLFVSLFICLLEVTEFLRVLFSYWVSF